MTAQAPDGPVVVDLASASWQHDPDDPPGGESSILRMDRQSGGMEFLARYPGGFAFKPHSHKANERFILFGGRAAVEAGGVKTTIGPAGFAYFPKNQIHSVACVSSEPCTWYLQWDGKP
jgi:quercetin dioxygenase-like cupin family protein